MTEDQLREKLRNENMLLRLEIAMLREQRRVSHEMERLRDDNRRLLEQVSEERLTTARCYQQP